MDCVIGKVSTSFAAVSRFGWWAKITGISFLLFSKSSAILKFKIILKANFFRKYKFVYFFIVILVAVYLFLLLLLHFLSFLVYIFYWCHSYFILKKFILLRSSLILTLLMTFLAILFYLFVHNPFLSHCLLYYFLPFSSSSHVPFQCTFILLHSFIFILISFHSTLSHSISALITVPLFQFSSISISFQTFKYILPLRYRIPSLLQLHSHSICLHSSHRISPCLIAILIFIPVYTPTSFHPFHFVFFVLLLRIFTRELQLHCNTHFHPCFTLQPHSTRFISYFYCYSNFYRYPDSSSVSSLFQFLFLY